MEGEFRRCSGEQLGQFLKGSLVVSHYPVPVSREEMEGERSSGSGGETLCVKVCVGGRGVYVRGGMCVWGGGDTCVWGGMCMWKEVCVCGEEGRYVCVGRYVYVRGGRRGICVCVCVCGRRYVCVCVCVCVSVCT